MTPAVSDRDRDEATMLPLLVAFGSFLTTLAGGLAALGFQDHQHLILGLTAGLLLGVVGFDLVREALTQQPGQLVGVRLAMLAAVLRRRALILLVADALAPVTGAAITLLVTIPPPILGL
jgi:hypothetical protein